MIPLRGGGEGMGRSFYLNRYCDDNEPIILLGEKFNLERRQFMQLDHTYILIYCFTFLSLLSFVVFYSGYQLLYFYIVFSYITCIIYI